MRAVNLLPKDQPQKSSIKREQVPFVAGACAGLVLTALLTSLYLSGSGKVAAARAERDDLQVQLELLPEAPPGPSAGTVKLASEQSTRKTALESALATRVAWDRVLRQFSLVLPEDVWLTQLQMKSPISPATGQAPQNSGAPVGFTMEGSTYSHDAVARLLSRLSVVPNLTNVQLVSSTVNVLNGQKVVKFSIAADIRGANDKASQ